MTPELPEPDLRRVLDAAPTPILLLGPDGGVELLERPRNLLLGVDPGTARQAHALPLRPGSTVVMYTDGLIERRDGTLDDGLRSLAEAARGLHRSPVEEVCDALLARMAPDSADDVALLVLRVADRRD